MLYLIAIPLPWFPMLWYGRWFSMFAAFVFWNALMAASPMTTMGAAGAQSLVPPLIALYGLLVLYSWHKIRQARRVLA